MSVIKAFFFDLDGTLVDTHQANTSAYTEAIRLVMAKEPSDTLHSLIKSGESSRDFLPKVVAGIQAAEIDSVNKRKKTLYPARLHESLLNEFLSNFLKQMFSCSTTVLVTTAKRENALAVLRHHGLEQYFTHMIFGDDVGNMKPHPEAYLLALKKTGLRKDEVLAFEDSVKGIESASGAGINVVHVRTFEL